MGLLLILLNRSTPTASFAHSCMRLHLLFFFFCLFVLNGFSEKPVSWSRYYRRGQGPPQSSARLEVVIGAHLARDQLVEESVLNNRKCVPPVIKALTHSCFGMILG